MSELLWAELKKPGSRQQRAGTTREMDGNIIHNLFDSRLSDRRAPIAGIWRDTRDVGEAFTMLTMEPGPDIAPYHDRQIVILDRDAWADWLDPSVPAASLVRPLPAGTLLVEQPPPR